MGITIRRSTDLDAIKALDAQLIGDVDPPKASHLWWLCREGDKIVGYCGLKIFEEVGVKRAFLSRAGVIRSARGRGLQKRMIRVREAEARRRGAKYVYTYTSYTNLASANSLIRCGYTLYQPQSDWGLTGGYYFTKTL